MKFLAMPLVGKLFTHTCFCHQAVSSCRAAIFCNWEGNRRSGVTLAVYHRLKWFIHLQPQGLNKEEKHPDNTPNEVRYSLPLPLVPPLR